MPGMYHLKKFVSRQLWQRNPNCFIHLKICQSRPLFVYFCPFLITILIIQNERNVDGVLRILTRGSRMVSADETTELMWLH